MCEQVLVILYLQIMKSNFRAAMRTKSLPWRNLTQKMVDDGTVASAADFQVMMMIIMMIMIMMMIMWIIMMSFEHISVCADQVPEQHGRVLHRPQGCGGAGGGGPGEGVWRAEGRHCPADGHRGPLLQEDDAGLQVGWDHGWGSSVPLQTISFQQRFCIFLKFMNPIVWLVVVHWCMVWWVMMEILYFLCKQFQDNIPWCAFLTKSNHFQVYLLEISIKVYLYSVTLN